MLCSVGRELGKVGAKFSSVRVATWSGLPKPVSDRMPSRLSTPLPYSRLCARARASDADPAAPPEVIRLGLQTEQAHAGMGPVLVPAEHKGRGRTVKTHEMPVLPALRASIDSYRAAVGRGDRHLVYPPTVLSPLWSGNDWLCIL
jgi:hypothetical protein